MIRQPTPEADAFAWWRAALQDPRLPRHDGEPQCGFYKRRLVKNGPWVPVRIYLRQEIDPDTGELTEPEEFEADQMGWTEDAARIWTHLRPVTQDEYHALLERHRTFDAMSATHAPIDVSETPIRPGGR